MIVNRWPPSFKRLYGGGFPESYCAIDCETSGFDTNRDVVIEFGHCLVRDCKPVNTLNLVIDWTDHDVIPDDWLRERLARVERDMRLSGRPWRVTYDVMKKEGVKPAKALRFIFDFLATVRSNGVIFASHNGYSFDERMLRASFDGFLDENWAGFGENTMIDTGAIEKASQAPPGTDVLPRESDTLEAYFRRIVNVRLRGVKWNLDTHCWNKYQLGKKPGLPAGECHTAGFDAFLVHLMMEEIRKQLEEPAPRSSGPSDFLESDYFSPAALAETFDQMMAKTTPRRHAELEDLADRADGPAPRVAHAPLRRRGQRNR